MQGLLDNTEFLEFVAQRPRLEEFDFQVSTGDPSRGNSGLPVWHVITKEMQGGTPEDPMTSFGRRTGAAREWGELDPKPQSIALEWGH